MTSSRGCYELRHPTDFEMMAKRAQDVCEWLLPNGRRKAQEWCVGGVTGEAGDSLRVNLGGKAGLWKDFADQDKGGDQVDLIMAVMGIGQGRSSPRSKRISRYPR